MFSFTDLPGFYLATAICTLISFVLLSIPSLHAQSPPGIRTFEHNPSTGRDSFQLFPGKTLFRPYLANPRTPRFGISFFSVSGEEIPLSGTSRVEIDLGGTFEIVRFWRHWQVDLGLGFVGWFDRDRSLDNIGWDGIYSLSLSRRLDARSALRFQFLHDSSHRGDEFVIRARDKARRPKIGERIDYTREELNIGYRRDLTGRLGWYAEGGWGILLNNDDLQEHGRLQTGLEFRDTLPDWFRGLGWYAALDLESFQENDWNLDTTLESGFTLTRGEGTWRLGFEYHSGRVPIGEFFLAEEDYISFGLWMEP